MRNCNAGPERSRVRRSLALRSPFVAQRYRGSGRGVLERRSTVSVAPVRIVNESYRTGSVPARAMPIHQLPGESDSLSDAPFACRRSVCCSPDLLGGFSAAAPGAAAARGPSRARSSSARARIESRAARSCSASFVRRTMASYRLVYVRARRSIVSSDAISVLSASRSSRNRASSEAELSSRMRRRVMLSAAAGDAGAASVALRGSAAIATTSNESASVVESNITTTSPDRVQPRVMSAPTSAATRHRAARGRI